MDVAVPRHIRELARSQPGNIERVDREKAVERLQELGIDPNSQLAAFYAEFSVVNMFSSSSDETLSDPAEPTPQMSVGTRFVRDVWKLPEEFVCLTSCQGEGCYLYSTRTGAVYDFELAKRDQFLSNPAAKWKDFNTFIEWYLTPARGQ